MLVFYHKDNDGYCSAAVCNSYLVNGYDMPSNDDFIGYAHGETLDVNELRPIRKNEHVYILDLALNDTIFEIIKHCAEAGAQVIHIDHHVTTLQYCERMSADEKRIMGGKNVITMYETAISACLLTFTYASMNEDEQKHPTDVAYTNTDDWTIMLIGEGPDPRRYVIPLAVRYCDDYDVWRFAHKDTEMFKLGFEAEPYRKQPWTKEWSRLLNQERGMMPSIIESGYSIKSYRDAQYERICENGYEATILGEYCYAVNTPYGDGKLFGEKIDEYPMCVMYYFDGKLWHLEFRSGDDGIDVSQIARQLGGGGHPHAAGAHIPDIDEYIRPL